MKYIVVIIIFIVIIVIIINPQRSVHAQEGYSSYPVSLSVTL